MPREVELTVKLNEEESVFIIALLLQDSWVREPGVARDTSERLREKITEMFISEFNARGSKMGPLAEETIRGKVPSEIVMLSQLFGAR